MDFAKIKKKKKEVGNFFFFSGEGGVVCRGYKRISNSIRRVIFWCNTYVTEVSVDVICACNTVYGCQANTRMINCEKK